MAMTIRVGDIVEHKIKWGSPQKPIGVVHEVLPDGRVVVAVSGPTGSSSRRAVASKSVHRTEDLVIAKQSGAARELDVAYSALATGDAADMLELLADEIAEGMGMKVLSMQVHGTMAEVRCQKRTGTQGANATKAFHLDGMDSYQGTVEEFFAAEFQSLSRTLDQMLNH